ncbi:MAG: peptidoglycan D,D-transpeptidase FtsI family protein [Solirubrobacterales bacterium]
MSDITKNIKGVLIVFLLCFIGLISYLTYFEVAVGPKIADNAGNKRLWVKRNEVLRGTIYDRNMKPLSTSQRIDAENQKRVYNGGAMFAHILGYEDIKYGITGLEHTYDSDLMSSSVQDSVMGFIKSGGKTPEKVGANLVTTLNYDIQKKAYYMLGDNRGAVVVLNPKTGEVLAMVSKPSFDPNNLDVIWSSLNTDKNRPLINRATQGLYPPGSTFKTITAISALENIDGIMNRTFEDNGKLVFNAKESLSNFNGEVLGNITFKQAYVHSSNVAFGTLGLELGNSKLKETAEKFFFNNDTPADGIIIENSQFPSFKSNEKGNIAQSAIGQSSVLASPMEMALVASTIANDGVMMKPYLVSSVRKSNGENVKSVSPQSIKQVISANTAAVMKDFMRTVVTEGTGGNAALSFADVCGKTGTADHSDDGSTVPHSWFIGFAPYNNPQVAVAVIVEDGGQGGIAAAQIAAGVMETALSK